MINLNNLKLIAYDFDGVMTDNRVYVDQNGNELVSCHRGDGLGINMLRKAGITQIVISTEKNPVVSARGKKLGINVIQGVDNKKDVLVKYCDKESISIKNVLFVGNDINDLQVIESCGYTACPADAHPTILEKSKIILKSNGGYGVIRELADLILFNSKENTL